jgi:hypothetical protein
MKWMLDITIPEPKRKISYDDSMLLIGSCFTANVGTALQELKFNTLHNPTGILFDPLSVARHLQDYTTNKQYHAHELVQLNDIWNSWLHHSEFSSVHQDECLNRVNTAIRYAHAHLHHTTMLLITLGTAFSYQLTPEQQPVANCHKAPANRFHKHLLSSDEIILALERALMPLLERKPQLQVVFTISPVRHIRDGVIENNRSKARLIEAVHHLVEQHERMFYFPSYELVMDVLRDYRFYDADLVHPNYAATQHVFDTFCQHYLSSPTLKLVEEVKQLVTARKHRPLHPDSAGHQAFLAVQREKLAVLKTKLPSLNWTEEEVAFQLAH